MMGEVDGNKVKNTNLFSIVQCHSENPSGDDCEGDSDSSCDFDEYYIFHDVFLLSVVNF